MKYHHKKHFLVCTGPRCNNPDRGEDRGEVIRAELKDLNKQLGRKPTVRVCGVSCLDLCDYGPNMIAYPEGEVYSHLDRASAKRVYHGEMGDAEKAEDKRLREEEIEGNRQ
ncbi:MAG TPA: (2Fe-2S) ferredoxin domain-containing protein [Thermoanaerobaculia bacterium]